MDSIAKKINIALATKEMNKVQLCEKVNIASGNLSNMLNRDTYKTDVLERIVDAIGYKLEIKLVDKETGEKI
jgi:DNA-binding Xre family transcriptional regulator